MPFQLQSFKKFRVAEFTGIFGIWYVQIWMLFGLVFLQFESCVALVVTMWTLMWLSIPTTL